MRWLPQSAMVSPKRDGLRQSTMVFQCCELQSAMVMPKYDGLYIKAIHAKVRWRVVTFVTSWYYDVNRLTSFKTIIVEIEAIDDIVDFKPNSVLSVGTNVFFSGYWRKEQMISIDIDDSKGKDPHCSRLRERKNTCTVKIFASSKYARNHSLCMP